jgi:purine-binding chemotaxis protein CheW
MSGPFVTFAVGNHVFGVPVEQVQDILTLHAIAAVPLGPSEVRGMINLRGRIVTVVDVRTRLGLKPAEAGSSRSTMGVTVENGAESYTLLVDRVGDVVTLPSRLREPNPVTLDPLWRELADGVFRIDGNLLVILDVERLLNIRAKP